MRARLPTTRWIRTRYSSLRCLPQKASVSAVMAANFSCMARGIFSGGGMDVVARERAGILPDRAKRAKPRRPDGVAGPADVSSVFVAGSRA